MSDYYDLSDEHCGIKLGLNQSDRNVDLNKVIVKQPSTGCCWQ